MAEKMDANLDYNNGQKDEAVIDTNRKLRVGIIGTGWIADSHIDSYKRMPDVEIVAGCDLIPGKAAAFFKKHGVEGVKTEYASHKEMLDDESLKLDAVSVCTYNRQHAIPWYHRCYIVYIITQISRIIGIARGKQIISHLFSIQLCLINTQRRNCKHCL